MALTNLSAQQAPYTSDDGTATSSATEQTLPIDTRTVTLQMSGAGSWGYTADRTFPLAANTPLEIPVDGRVNEVGGDRVTSLYIKGDAGGETVYLDCSPFRR